MKRRATSATAELRVCLCNACLPVTSIYLHLSFVVAIAQNCQCLDLKVLLKSRHFTILLTEFPSFCT